MRPTLLIPALAFALAACAAAPTIDRDDTVVQGEPAPEFNVIDQNGRSWSLADSYAQPVLVDLWATWCGPCLQALPDLNNFAKAQAGRVVVLGLATDQQGWPIVTPVIRRHELVYPVSVINPSLSDAFGAKAYPYLVVVDKGRIVKRLKGRHSAQDLESELAPWLH